MSSQLDPRAAGLAGELAVKRSVTVRVSEFACKAIAGEEGVATERIPSRIVRAIRCYLKDEGLGKAGWVYPEFLRETETTGPNVELELSIEVDLWRALEDEAERQHVSAQRLVEHAVFYLAAEINAGRVTRRILEDLGPDED